MCCEKNTHTARGMRRYDHHTRCVQIPSGSIYWGEITGLPYVFKATSALTAAGNALQIRFQRACEYFRQCVHKPTAGNAGKMTDVTERRRPRYPLRSSERVFMLSGEKRKVRTFVERETECKNHVRASKAKCKFRCEASAAAGTQCLCRHTQHTHTRKKMKKEEIAKLYPETKEATTRRVRARGREEELEALLKRRLKGLFAMTTPLRLHPSSFFLSL